MISFIIIRNTFHPFIKLNNFDLYFYFFYYLFPWKEKANPVIENNEQTFWC